MPSGLCKGYACVYVCLCRQGAVLVSELIKEHVSASWCDRAQGRLVYRCLGMNTFCHSPFIPWFSSSVRLPLLLFITPLYHTQHPVSIAIMLFSFTLRLYFIQLLLLLSLFLCSFIREKIIFIFFLFRGFFSPYLSPLLLWCILYLCIVCVCVVCGYSWADIDTEPSSYPPKKGYHWTKFCCSRCSPACWQHVRSCADLWHLCSCSTRCSVRLE